MPQKTSIRPRCGKCGDISVSWRKTLYVIQPMQWTQHLSNQPTNADCAAYVMQLCEIQWTNASTPWKSYRKITLYTCGHLQAFATSKCKWGLMWRFYI